MCCLRPQPRDKLGWYGCHRNQINKGIRRQASVVVIGDSLVRWLSRYPEVWKLLSAHNLVNFGLGGDRAENVLWRVDNLSFPPTVTTVVILVGTNNMMTDKSEDIAESIISSVVKLREKYPHIHVVVTGIIPRGLHLSPLREKIRRTNVLLKSYCENKPYHTTFIEQSDSWTNDSGRLTERFFYKDRLHLSKAGYHILANQIIKVIASLSTRAAPITAKPTCRKRAYSPLPPDICTYRPPPISSPSPPPLIITPVTHSRRHKRLPARVSPTPSLSPTPPPLLPPTPSSPPSSPSPPSPLPPTPPPPPPSPPTSCSHKRGNGRTSLQFLHISVLFFIFFAFLLGSVGIGVEKGRDEGVFIKGGMGVGRILNSTFIFIVNSIGMNTWGVGLNMNYKEYGGKGTRLGKEEYNIP